MNVYERGKEREERRNEREKENVYERGKERKRE